MIKISKHTTTRTLEYTHKLTAREQESKIYYSPRGLRYGHISVSFKTCVGNRNI